MHRLSEHRMKWLKTTCMQVFSFMQSLHNLYGFAYCYMDNLCYILCASYDIYRLRDVALGGRWV